MYIISYIVYIPIIGYTVVIYIIGYITNLTRYITLTIINIHPAVSLKSRSFLPQY